MGFVFFFLDVCLADHKIQYFIARQLVFAERERERERLGCVLFVVRDLLLVGVVQRNLKRPDDTEMKGKQ